MKGSGPDPRALAPMPIFTYYVGKPQRTHTYVDIVFLPLGQSPRHATRNRLLWLLRPAQR